MSNSIALATRMTRDFDLIRKILIAVQAEPAGSILYSINLGNEYDACVVNEHIDLLIDGGLLKGQVQRPLDKIVNFTVYGLTWHGHDFIQVAEHETFWNKAVDIVKDKGGAITFDLLKELVTSLAHDALGLP